ncbi:nucleoside triphosphate pyrophosphohydrolase, partial [Aquipuribacter sp. MA13-6]|uniref:nucleoside triphosphate pyrophosphohydrolase n=1 Tax=unclassified Aquipuribacter TaxID=2635084 RepID=UPI003EEC2242
MTEDHDRAPTPGSALLDVVAVMDRLRSPGGCPWDAEQTHASLTRYLLEETYEVLDAVDALETGATDADADLAEELGDVLLQVVFHARVAAERGAFDVDDVAAGLAAKLVRRHPHVFADEQVRTGEAVQARWDELKAAEKPHRGPLDGIPNHLPALARADKLLGRLERAGLRVGLPAADVTQVDLVDVLDEPATTPEAFGAALFSLAARARAAGVDPEAALRSHVGRVAADAAAG